MGTITHNRATQQDDSVTLQSGVTSAPTTGTPQRIHGSTKVIEATVAGTGAVTATVEIYGDVNTAGAGVLLATITLSGTTSNNDGFVFDAPWPYIWSKVTAISGTGATVTVVLSV